MVNIQITLLLSKLKKYEKISTTQLFIPFTNKR